MIRRREFITGISAAAWPLVVRAQQQTNLTIPWLDVLPGRPPREWDEGFRRGLADVGFSEGRDMTVAYHTTDTQPLPALAADMVRRRPAAIVAPTGISALAAKAATRDIPVIFLAGNDPVELGLVASFNRPAAISRASLFLAPRLLRNALRCSTKRCRPSNRLLC